MYQSYSKLEALLSDDASSSVERTLLKLILAGQPGDSLPSERKLAQDLSINRQPIREALQRLHRDGWIEIRHGRSTYIKNYLAEGGLSILATLARENLLDASWIRSLLELRLALAPIYTEAAFLYDAGAIVRYLETSCQVEDTADSFAAYDWYLHHSLCVSSKNPLYPMLVNSFATVYRHAGYYYFSLAEARQGSLQFYKALLTAASQPKQAADEMRKVMEQSLLIWEEASKQFRLHSDHEKEHQDQTTRTDSRRVKKA